jgi:protein-tyrosine phosphatase
MIGGRRELDHSASAVSNKDVMKVLESVETVPSLIAGSSSNGLYQGGWQAAVNEQFLVESKVGLVINTADALEQLFPKFGAASSLYDRLGIDSLKYAWQDSSSTSFTITDITQATDAIASTLASGKSVLVHCAQGRSRSGTVVVSYISLAENLTVDAALARVQEKRAMAQPNDHFMHLLRGMAKESAGIIPPAQPSQIDDEIAEAASAVQ